MKKLLLIVISILLFHASSYCQSLALKDILSLANKPGDKSSLTSKSFKLIAQKGESEQYVLNPGIDKEERLLFEYRGVSYWTMDINYVNTLLQQVRKQYKFLVKTKSRGGILYRFSGRDVVIFININQLPHGFSSISISK